MVRVGSEHEPGASFGASASGPLHRCFLRGASEKFNVFVPTAARWSRRYWELGEAGLGPEELATDVSAPERKDSGPWGNSLAILALASAGVSLFMFAIKFLTSEDGPLTEYLEKRGFALGSCVVWRGPGGGTMPSGPSITRLFRSFAKPVTL